MRRLYLKSPANLDYSEAIAWYKENQPGRAREFETGLENLFGRIKEHPEHFPEIAPTVRKALLRGFKYKIYFTVERDEIGVLAIYHPSRNPDALRERF